MAMVKRILLIDPSDPGREVLARRLVAQGYEIDEASDAVKGADMALSAPPSAVIADLWMPSISGVQLCRLLKSEPATFDVPVILCGATDEPRNRFWAERAGASSYVLKGRMSELVRAIKEALPSTKKSDSFFVQLSGGTIGIYDRIARHLDTALFDSVISSEIRALASAGSFERLFDQLGQFMSQVSRYRWLALSTFGPGRFAIHRHPSRRGISETQARLALGIGSDTPVLDIEDEDALPEEDGPEAIVCDVPFGPRIVARVALGPIESYEQDARSLMAIVGRELGGAVRMAALIEESQRVASTDPLTSLMNRRAFTTVMNTELSRSRRYGHPLSLILLDVDHFKHINDRHGHAGGDRVLVALGTLLRKFLRVSDHAARWGGEEFVAAYTSTALAGARIAAERLRVAISELVVEDDAGLPIPLTASIGISEWTTKETLDELVARADSAMYAAKRGGRNQVHVATLGSEAPVGEK